MHKPFCALCYFFAFKSKKINFLLILVAPGVIMNNIILTRYNEYAHVRRSFYEENTYPDPSFDTWTYALLLWRLPLRGMHLSRGQKPRWKMRRVRRGYAEAALLISQR